MNHAIYTWKVKGGERRGTVSRKIDLRPLLHQIHQEMKDTSICLQVWKGDYTKADKLPAWADIEVSKGMFTGISITEL